MKELRIKVDKIYFWTDSTTVLRWLHSKTCRYHIYVANRVGEILESSKPNQWRYVPTDQNPADDCSPDVEADALTSRHRWFRGAGFLYQRTEN